MNYWEGENVWRLMWHETDGPLWDLNDSYQHILHGERTVLFCGDKEQSALDDKAEATWDRIFKQKGRVEFEEFYKAMNA